jgi:hypothetical protein
MGEKKPKHLFDDLDQRMRAAVDEEGGVHTDSISRIRKATEKGLSSEESRARFFRDYDNESLGFWQALRLLIANWFKNNLK